MHPAGPGTVVLPDPGSGHHDAREELSAGPGHASYSHFILGRVLPVPLRLPFRGPGSVQPWPLAP